MKSSKGLGIGGILKLTLALMVASLFISVSTFGQIGSLVIEGMGNIQNATDYRIDVSNPQTLSSAAKFVRHRAGNDGCKQDNGKPWPSVYEQNNEHGGYAGLEGTYLTKKPNCMGTASTLARGDSALGRAQSAVYQEGQDMEGKYSRVNFEIKAPVVLKTSEYSGNTNWLEQRIVGVSRKSIQGTAMTARECNNINDGGVRERFLGMGDHFIVYFQPEEASEEPYRSDKFMQEFAQRLENRAYCHPDGEGYSWGAITISELDQHPTISATRRLENKIVLCPGDQGYIQMNKAKPLAYDEAGESVWSGSAANFPYIQITHLGTSANSTCLPAEMEPAAVFEEVKNIQRISLPLQMGQQLSAMVPNGLENAYRGFVEGVWEDSIADETLDEIRDEFGDHVLSPIQNGVEAVVDGAVDLISGTLGGIADTLGLSDTPDDLAEFLDEKGIDPMQDMFYKVQDSVTSAIDHTMKDSLHIELTFTNQHLDMDDDAYFGADFRGGFQINMWESGTNQEVTGKFETEPAGGLYHSDVPQGVIGAGELDALQSGWLDGNGGIENLGCYVKAELVLEQKLDANMGYPERAEQVWDIWIGDLVDQDGGADDCQRDQRIQGERAGIAWGGTSTLQGISVTVQNYHPSENELEVQATATSNGDGYGGLDGGMLEVGVTDGYTFNVSDFTNNCEGSSCSISANISNINVGESPTVKAKFSRDNEAQDQTQEVDVSEHASAATALGPELWSWSSEYNSSENFFNVTVTYGDINANRDQVIDSASLTLKNVSESTTSLETVSCENTGEATECILDLNELSPAGDGELDLNATITKNGLSYFDTRTLSPP